MERVQFSTQSETEQSEVASDEMKHEPAESVCQYSLCLLHYPRHCCRQIVKPQPGRYPAYVLKDSLQPCQQTFLVWGWKELRVFFIGLWKRNR